MLLVSIIGFGVLGTCINFVPRYKEHHRYPNALLTSDNITTGNFILRSIQWPTNYPECSAIESEHIAMCQNAQPVINSSFYDNIIDYLHCQNDIGDSVSVNSLDTSFFEIPSNNSLAIIQPPLNGSFCYLYVNYMNIINEDSINCVIQENPEIGQCFTAEGSHVATFLTYLILRVLQGVFINTMFSLMDGTAMHLVKQHNSNYALVLVWNSLAGVFGPLISGALVEDSNDPTSI